LWSSLVTVYDPGSGVNAIPLLKWRSSNAIGMLQCHLMYVVGVAYSNFGNVTSPVHNAVQN
jgi:hypothetical protein